MKSKIEIVLLMAMGIAFAAPQASFAEVITGQPAPDFSLTDVEGSPRSLSKYDGKYRVLEWTNPECPFVKKHYSSGNMQRLQETSVGQGVVWLSINSSAPGKQGNFPPERWRQILEERRSAANATLLDPEGKVGKLYGAQTTPHLFIVDPKGILIYQGAIDSIASADPADVPKARNHVQAALEEAMAGKPVSVSSTQSYGCSVKY